MDNSSEKTQDPVEASSYPDFASMSEDQKIYELHVLSYGNSMGRYWLGELNAARWGARKQIAQMREAIEKNPDEWDAMTVLETFENFVKVFLAEETE